MRGVIFIAAVLLIQPIQAQVVKYSNEFLAIGVGARAAGMGNSVMASVDDGTSAYWNPAGLTGIQNDIQVSLMHNEHFASIVKQDYGTVAFKLKDKSAIALSVIRVGVDDIPNTINLYQNGQIDYSRIQSFSAIDYAFLMSYARATKIENLTWGANAKIIRRVVGEFANAWGFGIDIGAQYQWRKYKIGAMLRDATTTFNAWEYTFTDAEKQVLLQTNNKLPDNTLELTAPKTQVGVARKWVFFNERFSVMPEVNADITFDGKKNVWLTSTYFNVDPRIGLEMGYKNVVFLRGGAMQFQQIADIDGTRSLTFMPSIGAGVRINNFCVDYALANAGSNSSLPYSNVISIRIGINKRSG